ncbi:unnamed protein product [Cuscuta epithymum]|uniref:Early nodulin-like protein 1 n=1 Tax=Cuscuta epithymum TaxID=186058 RepID=A0AAV0EYP3_9ASTE|nr:unnamed protein product [Cuscuta epithymum]
MGVSTSPVLFFSLLFCFTSAIQLSESATIVVDRGLLPERKNATVHVGDSIIFQDKYEFNVYIFQNLDAFNACNFSQATLLTKSDSRNWTWHTRRPGSFYFSFYNGSNKACLKGQKVAIKITASSPESPAPSPGGSPLLISGGIVSSSPSYPWPFQPHEMGSPSSAPVAAAFAPANSQMDPEKGGVIPFISSNPAVPLPTGEVDSATILPAPASDHSQGQVVRGLTILRASFTGIFLMMLLLS